MTIAATVLLVLRAALGEQLEPDRYTVFSKQTLVEAIFDFNFTHLLWKYSFAALLVLWVFAFGASIGSFLNVVVYRMPRGESLNKRGSHCPYCNRAIRLRDNLPVFGWLNLRGRCHVCRLPISSRYPVVEFVTGVIFVFYFLFEVGTGGEFLPLFEPLVSRDGLIGVFSRHFEDYQFLIGIFALHMTCVVVLWAAMLIERDRNRVPWKLIVIPMLISLSVSIVWPQLVVVDWFAYSSLKSQPDEWQRIARRFTPVVGLVVATAHGYLLGWLVDRSELSRRKLVARRMIFAIACGYIGLTFGWQAMLSISLPFVVALYLVRSAQQGMNARHGFDRYGLLLGGVMLHWIAWKWIHGSFETNTSGAPFLFYGLLAIVVAAILRVFPALPLHQKKAHVLLQTDDSPHGDETIGPSEDTIATIVDVHRPTEKDELN